MHWFLTIPVFHRLIWSKDPVYNGTKRTYICQQATKMWKIWIFSLKRKQIKMLEIHIPYDVFSLMVKIFFFLLLWNHLTNSFVAQTIKTQVNQWNAPNATRNHKFLVKIEIGIASFLSEAWKVCHLHECFTTNKMSIKCYVHFYLQIALKIGSILCVSSQTTFTACM